MSLDSMKPTRSNNTQLLPLHRNREGTGSEDSTKRLSPEEASATPTSLAHPIQIRNLGASPPVYLLVPAFTPVAVAIYICSTRYAQFYHHGFDIICGALIGILTAVLSFRWYHLPLSRGQGWAWGSRSRSRAFGIGVGTGGYVGNEGWLSPRRAGEVNGRDDVEGARE